MKGVGEALSLLFAKKEVFTIRDALYFFPRSYEDRREIFSAREAPLDRECTVLAKIVSSRPVFYSQSRRRAFEVIVTDDSGMSRLTLTWFHGPFDKAKLVQDHWVLARGLIKSFRGQRQIVHPEIEILGKNFELDQVSRSILPVYSETAGLYQKTIRRLIRSAVNQYAHAIKETIPDELLAHYRFPQKVQAIRDLHFPSEDSDIQKLANQATPAHHRLIYEEFFELSLALSLKRRDYETVSGISFSRPVVAWEKFKANMPFQFTSAQRRVLSEILNDMTSSRRMHRLVQGDVGSGKTVVAAASALIALESGYQVAFMAPTEILVDQHLRNAEKWFAGLPYPLVRLTGSMSSKDRKSALAQIKEQSPCVVFGTHALFENDVQFHSLGFVIVDEQHRFGVRQRAALLSKGQAPDLLVMTATPIPRTLALTLYGDLELSIIDELPPGRKPIVTKLFTEREREKLQSQVLIQLKSGRQVYIVFPLIEESEKLQLKSVQSMLEQLRESYPGYRVEPLHGRMKQEEKDTIIRQFRAGEIQVLVSTTVIEVGVDNPNASVMIIEHAERFGLSQLHQLRGRVGRGSYESYCFLLASHLGNPDAVERLRMLEQTQDGFKVAEFDLQRRGSGEFMGTRQSGLPQFQLAQLPRDLEWFYRAQLDVKALIAKDPQLDALPFWRERMKQNFDSVQLN